MRFESLEQWLAWQESLNPKTIDLGLERVREVLASLGIPQRFNCPVVTVAGTNGKGSSVAMMASILSAADYRVGCYTSPHLFRYNERIRMDGVTVSDDQLCQAFEQVDQARGQVPLTYFEFGTLAALWIFYQSKLDAVILEVGLGGRLDAVNVIDPDVALVTSVGLDHMDWLGDNIEAIGREKAGIFRSGRPAVYGSLMPVSSIQQVAEQLGAHLLRAGKDYLFQNIGSQHWQLRGPKLHYSDLPLPALPGQIQVQNAAAVLIVLSQLNLPVPPSVTAISSGLQQVRLAGRYQLVHQHPQVIVDVAHNPQAAKMLSDTLLASNHQGRTLAVVAMLADKAVAEVIQNLSGVVDEWFTAGLNLPRGLDADSMAKAVNRHLTDAKLSAEETVAKSCQRALQTMTDQDRLIVFGSFYTVAEASEYFNGLNLG